MSSLSDFRCYTAYGLSIRSVLRLPELPRGGDGGDLEIRLGRIDGKPTTIDEAGFGFSSGVRQACHVVEGVGAFQVSDGIEIVVDPEDGVPEELLRLSLLGPGLALALHQRGLFVLHASSIGIGTEGVTFVGGFASGKSTMAAAFQRLGHAVLSDDVTAVDVQLEEPAVVPSFPQLKLWPDAVSVLGLSVDELPKVHPDHPKRALRFSEGFAATPLPLRRIYVLAVGEDVSLEPLTPIRRFEEIMRHWYANRFGPELLASIDLRQHVLHAGQIARTVPVRRLIRPASLKHDPQLPGSIERAILQDLERE